jgi:hypothetical protein
MSTESYQRRAVVREARSWVRTPYHPQGDIKGIGVDCGMLLVRVFVDTGLCDPFDPRPYADDWYLHRSEERYLGFIFDRTKEVDEPYPGDVMVFRYGRCYAHGGDRDRDNPADHCARLSAGGFRARGRCRRQCPSFGANAPAKIFLLLGGGVNGSF